MKNVINKIGTSIVRFMLRVDRYVIKRYLGIETPLYKAWWANHSQCIQKQLDKLHNTNYYAEYSL